MSTGLKTRPFDVVVWGATGFTGKLTCSYLKNNYPKLKWAIAGRNVDKLNPVKTDLNLSDIPVLFGSIDDINSLNEITKQTKVLLTTAGPYSKYGTPIVESCVQSGTNYCDLTGEPTWIREIIDKYHNIAKEKQIKIVNCCGYDCIPSDLGNQMIVNELIKKNLKPKEVRLTAYDIKGAASGGTIASAFSIFENTKELINLSNPFYLNPKENNKIIQTDNKSILSKGSDSFFFGYDKIEKLYTMPYIMQSIDVRLVNRSNALLNFKYGKDFLFTERMGSTSIVYALLISLAFPLVGSLLLFQFTRNLLKKILPSPGQGPSEKARDKGYFKMKLYGIGIDENNNEVIVKGGVIGLNGDPGYKQTAKLIGESAVCLAFDEEKLPKNYGIITPSVGMGEVLTKRLIEKGFEFFILEK